MIATTTDSTRFSAGLKGDQLSAFEKLTGLMSAHQRITKLCGYAGSGKTFLLARLAAWAQAEGFQVTVAAPTHKAVGVIKQKLNGAGGIEVRTIHSLLGLRLEPDYEADTGGRILNATDSKSKVKAGSLVICDEASMVGSVLKEHIDAQRGVTWLFVGDLAQLPPVGEKVSELLDEPDCTLNQVLRQADGSEILNLATRIRGGDKSMAFEADKDVFQVDSAETLFQQAKERFASPEFQSDPCHARMLVFRNDRRKAVNNRMRDILIGSPEPYAAGEWLIMYSAFCPEKSALNMMAEKARAIPKGSYGCAKAWKKFFDAKALMGANITQLHVSEEVRVVSATDGAIRIGEDTFRVHRLKVWAPARDKEFELPVLFAEEVDRVQELMGECATEARELRKQQDALAKDSKEWAELDKQRKSAWGMFFSLEETFASVDYAYCMTTHKSQGSTFDHVYVDVPDLLASGGMQQRILYTACTRAAKSMTFYA